MNLSIRKTFALSAVGFSAAHASACSVCIAHPIGAGLQALGAQTLHKGSVVIGLSYTAFSKSQAGDLPGTTERHRQGETMLDVMKGLDDRWMLRASVPFLTKRMDMTGDPTVNTQGLGDITLGGTYQIPSGLKDKILFATSLDVKLPTGRNGQTDGLGSRLDEHSQIGTGSTDFSLGLLATYEDIQHQLWFAGLRVRWNGRNGTGYHYGNVLFYNVGFSHDLDPASSFVTELNGRFAAKDRMDTGDLDENSGGHLGYLSLSYRRNLGPATGLIASYQIPVLRNLNGTQSESGLITIGIYTRK